MSPGGGCGITVHRRERTVPYCHTVASIGEMWAIHPPSQSVWHLIWQQEWGEEEEVYSGLSDKQKEQKKQKTGFWSKVDGFRSSKEDNSKLRQTIFHVKLYKAPCFSFVNDREHFGTRQQQADCNWFSLTVVLCIFWPTGILVSCMSTLPFPP